MVKRLKDLDVPPEIALLKGYVEKERVELANKRKVAMEAKGFKEYYKFAEGETRFKLLPVVPREKTGSFGDQAIFRIEVQGTEYDLSVSKKSPVFRTLLDLLLQSPKTLKMLRVGLEKDTRMTVKEV